MNTFLPRVKEWIVVGVFLNGVSILASMVYVSAPGSDVFELVGTILLVATSILFVVYMVMKFILGWQDASRGWKDGVVLIGGALSTLFTLFALASAL